MKLGIFGDSYAAGDVFHNGVSWPRILAEKYNCPYNVFARGGTSLFYSYTNFINGYKNFSHIVFVYTDYMRVQTMPGHLEQFANVQVPDLENLRVHFHNKIDKTHQEELFYIAKARQYTDDINFSRFIYQTIFDNVNQICKDNDIKLVNIHPFEKEDNEVISLEKNNGSCLLNLHMVSAKEVSNTPIEWSRASTLKHPSFKILLEEVDVRPNHLNTHNNRALADVVSSSFDNINEPLDLAKVDDFSYNTDILVEMIENFNNED